MEQNWILIVAFTVFVATAPACLMAFMSFIKSYHNGSELRTNFAMANAKLDEILLRVETICRNQFIIMKAIGELGGSRDGNGEKSGNSDQ